MPFTQHPVDGRLPSLGRVVFDFDPGVVSDRDMAPWVFDLLSGAISASKRAPDWGDGLVW